MKAQILDGKKVAEEILKLKKKGTTPSLAIILVGEDLESLIYIREKKEKAKELGINFRLFKLNQESQEEKVIRLIKELNQDPKIHGILVQLPLPSNYHVDRVLNTILPQKEVDGITSHSLYPPACAFGIMKILSYYRIPVKDKKVVIVGKGRIAGKPLYKLMKKEKAKVSIYDSKTSDLESKTKKGEILIGATSFKNIIKLGMVRKGAVVIDVAKNVEEDVKKVASFMTPKIGGVGPVTVAMLLKNVVEAAKKTAGA